MRSKLRIDWRETPQGIALYRTRRAEAQARANATGFDHLLTKNDLFRDYMICMVPERKNRFGRDLDGEIVSCENLERCQLGHGPKG